LYRKQLQSQYPKRKPKIAQQYLRPVKPMLCKDGTIADVKVPTKRQQRKFDGSRSCVVKDFDDVSIIGSRTWTNDYGKNHPEIVEEIRKLPADRLILDGEFTFFKKGTDRDFFLNALSTRETIDKYNGVAKLVVFDVLYVDNDSLEELPFDDRNEILRTLIPKDMKYLIIPKTVKNVKQKEQHFQEMERRKFEGVVEKEAESPYRQGERTPEWLKIKNWKSDEAIVVGCTRGNGKNSSTFGSLIIAQLGKDGKLHFIGKASGLKGFEAEQMLKKLKATKVSKSPLVGVPYDVAGEVQQWCSPKVVIEVKYLNRTENGLLRMPDFLRERPDKKPSEVTLKPDADANIL
jgi:bifunctional non-homologous end joining protein LigD